MPAQTLGYNGVLYEDRRIFYPDPMMVAELYPAATPFYSSILAFDASRGGSQTVPDKDYKMFEHRASWRYQTMQINGAPVANWSGSNTPGETATIEVDGLEGVNYNASLINTYIDIWNEDETVNKGRALITDVLDAGTNRLELKALGSPTSADFSVTNLADNDKLYVVSTAFGEGDDAPEADSDTMEVVWNSVERHRTSVEITEDLRRAELRARRKELSRVRNERQKEHNMKAARAFLLGLRTSGIGGIAHGAGGGTDSQFTKDGMGNVTHITDKDGRRVTTTMGFITALQRYGNRDATDDSQNYFVVDGQSIDYVAWVDICDRLFQYAGDDGMRTAFVGAPVISFFATKAATNNNGWNITLSPMQQSRLGFWYQTLTTPHGGIRLVKLPILRRTPYANMMILPHMEYLGRAQYAPDQYHTNIKTDNNPDIQKDELTSWHGLKIRLMERHAAIDFKNLLISTGF